MPETKRVYQELDSNQDHFGQMITAPSDAVDRKLRPNSNDKKQKSAEAIVLASGNLGLIYFTEWPQRMTLEQINKAYPKMITGLTSHAGIGFIMLTTQSEGAVVIGSKGKYYLSNNKVEGENPLKNFGEHAALHLRRTDSFRFLPDILVMSLYDSEKDEVAAFEELVGSHGGLGGDQSKPFILYPSEWNLADREIVGAEEVYKVFKSCIEKADVEA
jgi:putative membrane protein